MRKKYGFVASVLTILLTMALPITALANPGIEEGHFSDFETLTWTTWDGVSTTYGRGPVFSDIHPEITDPEYFLKNKVYLTGKDDGIYINVDAENNQDAVVIELKKFVNSFDWIHSDELTRATKVYERIANGQHGNVYASSESENAGGFPLLINGKGQCRDFSDEFMKLARFVGLECETYEPFYMHQACLVKISGQWFATDPTGGDAQLPFLSNAVTYPVDYETEKNRYAKESDAKREQFYAENPDSWVTRINEMDRQLAAGEITEQQYDEMSAALISEK